MDNEQINKEAIEIYKGCDLSEKNLKIEALKVAVMANQAETLDFLIYMIENLTTSLTEKIQTEFEGTKC